MPICFLAILMPNFFSVVPYIILRNSQISTIHYLSGEDHAQNAYMTAPMCGTWTARGLQDRETTAQDHNHVADRTSVHRPLAVHELHGGNSTKLSVLHRHLLVLVPNFAPPAPHPFPNPRISLSVQVYALGFPVNKNCSTDLKFCRRLNKTPIYNFCHGSVCLVAFSFRRRICLSCFGTPYARITSKKAKSYSKLNYKYNIRRDWKRAKNHKKWVFYIIGLYAYSFVLPAERANSLLHW